MTLRTSKHRQPKGFGRGRIIAPSAFIELEYPSRSERDVVWQELMREGTHDVYRDSTSGPTGMVYRLRYPR